MKKIQWSKKRIVKVMVILIALYLLLSFILTWSFPCRVFNSMTNHELCIVRNSKNFEEYGTFTPIGVTGLFSEPKKECFSFVTAPRILPRVIEIYFLR